MSERNGDAKEIELLLSDKQLSNDNQYNCPNNAKRKRLKFFKKSEKSETSKSKDDENELPAVSFFQLFKYAKTIDKVYIGIGIIGALVASASWPILNVLFGAMIDVFVNFESGQSSEEEFMDGIYFISAAQFIGWVVITISNYLLMTLFPLAALNQIHTIKIKYFESILKQEISWSSRVSADLKRVEDGLNEKLGLAINSIGSVIINLVIAFTYGWKLSLVVLAISPFTAVATAIMNKVQASFARKEMESYAGAGNVAEEVISSVRTVYAFGGESKEVDRYEKNLVPAMKSGIKRNFITGVGNGVLYSTLYFGMALGIWFGVKLIIGSMENKDNEYSIGRITTIFWCVLSAGYSIGAAAPHFEAVNMARGTAAVIFNIIEKKSKIDISSKLGKTPEKFTANIEFKDIQFCYPMRSEVNILETFNLKVNAGETIALVGPSGCGKSTLIQLIQRFYDPISGGVYIDGHDIKDLNLGWLREQIGVVGQEPVLFDTSIKENIKLGSRQTNLTQTDIEVASQEANAHEFISKLPDTYETYVGDRGAQLSGGQKQRIAIARALINGPKILLLDEATSALDMQSESLVQTALDKASKGRTTIIVAHRLSTIINADRIIFIEKGRVMEMGTHRQLMDKKGLYFNLVITQQKNSKNIKKIIKYNQLDDVDLDPMSYKRTISVISSSGNSAFTSDTYGNDQSAEEDQEEGLQYFSQTRLLKMLSLDKYYIFCGLICSVLYGFVVPLYSYLFGLLVAVFAEENDIPEIRDQSYKFAFYYIGLGVAVGFVSVTQITMLGIASERLTMRLRKMAFGAILRQEIGWFDKVENSTGSLCARLSADAANIQGASGSRMSIICQAITTFVTSAIVAYIINWRLSLVTSAFIPFIVIGGAFAASVDNNEMKSTKEANEKSSKIAMEAMGSIRTVASLHQEMYFFSKYSDILVEKLRISKRKYYLRGFYLSNALSILLLAYAVVFIYGGILMTKKMIKSGEFFIVIETLIYGAQSIGSSTVFAADYQKAKVAAGNMFKLIDRKPISATNNCLVTEKPDKCDGNVTFRGCFFNYPNRPDAQILNGLSLKVHKGETVALVGSSGCGKSTTIQLLEKFYDLNRGKIFVDGKNINTLDTEWLRSKIALVSQEPNLFSYSIAENIAYGDNSRFIPMDQIVLAAQKANIHNFIKDLPNGYDTNVGSKGAQLSGGQKQRIAIARALVRNPQILLLDEATSALDTASEKLVQDALDEASKGRTCIVIAHRLTTIQNANKIVVIQRGLNVEEGTHEELLDKNGFYHELYKTQPQ